MITLDHVSKRFGKKTVVDQLSSVIPSGKITGFIGPNGAGKTTTISMICGILEPNDGTIDLNGISITRQPLEAKKTFCLIPDTPDLFLRLSGLEYINFMADLYEVDPSVRKTRIESLAREFEIEKDLSTQMQDYSHGMRQKALIIAALVCDPQIWILDEPLTGLDPTSAFLLKEKMRQEAAKGKTVFFSTHVLEVAERLCDKILLINHGKLVYDGTLEALKDRYPDQSLEDIYLRIIQDPENRKLVEEMMDDPV